MEFKQELKISMKVESDGRSFEFIMPVDSPLGIAYDACHQVMSALLEHAKKSAEASKQTQAKPEETTNIS